jgi:hypothetical protein
MHPHFSRAAGYEVFTSTTRSASLLRKQGANKNALALEKKRIDQL